MTRIMVDNYVPTITFAKSCFLCFAKVISALKTFAKSCFLYLAKGIRL
jgi:hypothetical protein